MMFAILEKQIRLSIENRGRPPRKIGVTREQFNAMISSVPFATSKDASPDDVPRFMGIPVEIMCIKDGAGWS